MGEKNENELSLHYKTAYERIVNRFIWNGQGVFYSDKITVSLCFKEAINEVENLTLKATLRGDMTAGYHQWSLSCLQRKYKEIMGG